MKWGGDIMEDSKKTVPKGLTRREALKLSGVALGGLAIGGAAIRPGVGNAQTDDNCDCPEGPTCDWSNYPDTTLQNQYSYFESLGLFNPYDPNTKTTIAPLGENEMRITFMGSCVPPVRRAQQMMSIFVEVGWDSRRERPLDQFVFDCGSGVCANYGAMNVGFGRMNKIFLTHLHGDHASDLSHIYCFGPSGDRKSPLYVWGPGPSGVQSPAWGDNPPRYYDDGTNAFCENLRRAWRWHSESFSFETTSYKGYIPPTRESWGLPHDPVPVDDDPPNEGYALVPIQLKWWKYGKRRGDNIAYWNKKTGVKITHFPVIHTRKGSIGYKLEWNGLTMIYTGDTKPEYHSRDQAINADRVTGDARGVDVFIHEMAVPPQVWSMKMNHSDELPRLASPEVQDLTRVENSSHSPQGSFGYLLSQISPRPRLTVATHFPVADDMVACALQSVQAHCPEVELGKNMVWSFDLMVIRVTKEQITQFRGYVSDYGFSPTVNEPPLKLLNTPKYNDPDTGKGDPLAQIDLSTEIPPCGTNTCNYREDGY
jgi:ribonuclease Z